MIAQRITVQTSTRAATARKAVVVRAEQQQTSRRSLLGLVATGVAVGAAALLPAQEAAAIKIASQEFTGGLVRGGGNTTKSATKASMAGYTLEGTKKSGITPKRKAKLLAKVREQATAAAAKK